MHSKVSSLKMVLKAIILFLVFVHREIDAQQESCTLSTCQSQLYCEGSLLEMVQLNKIFPTSKTFVDMATKETGDEVVMKWQKLFKDTKKHAPVSVVKRFVSSHFSANAQALARWQPSDFNPEPWFLEHINDNEVRQLAKYCVGLWNSLGRKVANDDVETHSSLLYVPNGFIIPSSRYSEMYYWDSYWIVEGLLLCEMDNTAKGMIDNFIHLIKHFGFVPAGGRMYYTTRSQPPLLTFMVWQYLLKTRNFNWLNTIIKYLDRELQWWVKNKLLLVDINGLKFQMARYVVECGGPRPEMYYEDYKAVDDEDEETKQSIFNDIKAASESGWDLSSRWMLDETQNDSYVYGVKYLKTSNISPVDLNSFLYGAFMRLSSMYLILEDYGKRSYWYNLARELKKTIQLVLWDEHDGVWYDYNLDSQKPIKRYAASNLTPLWVDAYNDTLCLKGNQAFRAASYLVKLGINKYKGGIPVTLAETGQSWDYPNAWPPMQSIIVQGLRRSGQKAANVLAEEMAKRWIKANMISLKKRGMLYDYYDADIPGKSTDRKKYSDVTGGCSSAVLLDFINTYYIMTKKNSTLLIVS